MADAVLFLLATLTVSGVAGGGMYLTLRLAGVLAARAARPADPAKET